MQNDQVKEDLRGTEKEEINIKLGIREVNLFAFSGECSLQAGIKLRKIRLLWIYFLGIKIKGSRRALK